jgi:Ca2+-binding EF-hand superfamily protein
MSSKFAKQYQIPPEFPEILKDFTREVLRNQPANINEFAVKYFDCLAQGLPADNRGGGGMAGGDEEPEMSLEEVEAIIQDLFHKYDSDGNGYLDPKEFKALMTDLQQRMDFPVDEVYRFLSEADQNADGMIEYEEFIPLALQIIQGMYAKKRFQQHMQDVEQQAEDLLVHGMARDELTEIVAHIFERMDGDGSGTLSKQEFISALTSMELGLTRREINTIMFQIDQDQDGNISYREFVPFAFDLLHKLTSLRLLETEMEHDELAQFLGDLFKSKDTEMTGHLHVDDMRDLLHQAMLGLSRMQIYTVISEADTNTDAMIAYANFIPRAVGLIRSMLSFEKSILHESKETDAEAEENFYMVMDEALQGADVMPPDTFCQKLQAANLLDGKELQAVKNLVIGYGDSVPVEDAKAQVWPLVKNVRRHKGLGAK